MGELWEVREGCSCKKCKEAVLETTKCRDDHKNDTKVEFQYDQNFFDREIFEEPITILQVEFNKIPANSKIWFSGIVALDNDDNDYVPLILNIVRTRENGLSNTIYTQYFEVDEENNDDITQVPFAHVEIEANDIKNVTYTVTIQRDQNFGDVFLFGQSTLAATRFS